MESGVNWFRVIVSGIIGNKQVIIQAKRMKAI